MRRDSFTGLQDEDSCLSGGSSFSGAGPLPGAQGHSSTAELQLPPAPSFRTGPHADHSTDSDVEDSSGAASPSSQPLPHPAVTQRAPPTMSLRAPPPPDMHLQAVAMGPCMPTIITTTAALFQTVRIVLLHAGCVVCT